MTKLCLLYLEAGELSVWQRDKNRSGGAMREIARFRDTPDGWAQFSAFLAVDRKIWPFSQTRYALLVNLPDESFVSETLPKLRASERATLLAAKARRLFPDSPWHCASRNQPRHPGDASWLLMALGKNKALNCCVERLQAAHCPLVSVHGLAQLLPALLKTRSRGLARQSLITLSWHDAWARFSLISDGSLRLSRLTPCPEPGALADEYRRFVDYLGRLGSLPADPGLCVIADAERQAQIDLPHIVDRLVSPAANSAALFLALPRRHWPAEQFAPPALRQHAIEQNWANWLWRSSALAIALGTGLSLERLQHEQSLQQRIAEAQQQSQRSAAAIAKNDEALKHSPLNRQQLQQLAHDYPDLLAARTALPMALQTLSQHLEKSPAITLERLVWKIEGFAPSTVKMQIDVMANVANGNERSAKAAVRQFHDHLKTTHRVRQQPAPGSGAFLLELSPREKT